MTTVEWKTMLPPTLEAIESFCKRFQTWRADHCAGIDAFGVELLVREALTNSVVHGAPRISGVFRVKRGRLIILIRDEGVGFDWRASWDRQADISDTNGRGVEIFRRYADQVRFNARGNAVILIIRFGIGMQNE
jgi:anti-sigma regulatory factor (Ser/Thr protein kinase)